MSAGRHIISLSQSWGTPEKYVHAVKEFFGGVIDLDPCSNSFSIVHAKMEFILPEHDGLHEEWNYPRIYVNPPYGLSHIDRTSIKDWLAKCADAQDRYQAEVLALIPVATNTTHWKRYVFTRATAICFLADTRLRFLENGKDGGKGAPMACAMVYWGKQYTKFEHVFCKYGAVVNIENLQSKAAISPMQGYML
jgi:hypothetical protein